eukprot:UN09631
MYYLLQVLLTNKNLFILHHAMSSLNKCLTCMAASLF